MTHSLSHRLFLSFRSHRTPRRRALLDCSLLAAARPTGLTFSNACGLTALLARALTCTLIELLRPSRIHCTHPRASLSLRHCVCSPPSSLLNSERALPSYCILRPRARCPPSAPPAILCPCSRPHPALVLRHPRKQHPSTPLCLPLSDDTNIH